MEDKNLFREKSLKRISSPEMLNDYVKVASPAIWILIVAIILVLAGSFVWSYFYTLEEKVSATVYSDGKEMIMLVAENEIDALKKGMEVHIDKSDAYYQISDISSKPIVIDDKYDDYYKHVSGLFDGDWVYVIRIENSLKTAENEGVYSAEIVTNTVRPMDMIFN